MTNLEELKAAAEKALEAFLSGGPFANEMRAYHEVAGPSTILSLIATIRDLERERDEAREKGMMEERNRCARIARTTHPQDADFSGVWREYEHGCDDTQGAIYAAIRAEAKGSGG